MSLSHNTTLRNQVADLIVDAIDAGAGAGQIVFRTSANAEVATLTFSDPAFGNAANGTATANPITSDTNATGGTMANFRVQDSDATQVFDGTVTATGGGGDITFSSVVRNPGDTVEISNFTYTAMA